MTRRGAGLDTLAPAVDGLARAAAVVPGLAGADGPRTILVMFQNPLSNTADAALIESYPMSMTTGGGLWGTGVGDIGTTVTVAAPPGSAFGGATGEEGRLPSVDVIADGHPSTAVRVNISRGQTESVDFAFTAPEAGVPVLVHTPMLDDVETSVPDSARPCA